MTPPTQPEPSAGALVIADPIGAGDVAQLCQWLSVLLDGSDVASVVCDVHGVQADCVAVEALARLQLTARRRGRRIRLRGTSQELDLLLSLVGLADVLPLAPGLGGGLTREAEEREQPRGVEERVDRENAVP